MNTVTISFIKESSGFTFGFFVIDLKINTENLMPIVEIKYGDADGYSLDIFPYGYNRCQCECKDLIEVCMTTKSAMHGWLVDIGISDFEIKFNLPEHIKEKM